MTSRRKSRLSNSLVSGEIIATLTVRLSTELKGPPKRMAIGGGVLRGPGAEMHHVDVCESHHGHVCPLEWWDYPVLKGSG